MNVKRKSTGLAALVAASKAGAIATAVSPPTAVDLSDAAPALPAGELRQRGKGATVALTYRVNQDQWKRLHDLALTDGLSLNQLVLTGLNEIFVKRGLPPL